MMSVFSISNIVAPLNAAVKAASAASSFFAMIDAPSIKREGLKEPDVSAGEDILFKGVTFAYPSRPHVKVLDDLDVCFETGKLTAIVGPSGSGKSTIVGLMERWYELSAEAGVDRELVSASNEKSINGNGAADDKLAVTLSGTITVGGRDLRDLDLKWWRSQIGLVQQEPFIFNDTIYNNVANGLVGSKFENEDDEMKRRRVEEACKEAFADEFISRLPMGYETKVGDSGIKLSGGQRQRLAIARSIIKRPMILIFDEATSAIDVRGERIVQDALDRVAKNRTTITIAHRLSTIKKADKIIVVAKGKVVEQGTHDGLLAKEDGVYSNLVHAQRLTMDAHVEELLKVPSSDLAAEDSVMTEKPVATKVEETPYVLRGFLRSFGFLLIEQKAHVLWLVLTIAGALGSATSVPLQSYLFAQLVAVFQEPPGQQILDDSAHWALMFVVLACCIGATYLIVGWAASTLSTHVACTYRLEYFESITKKPIEFYDADENSSGTLTSRVANDPTQLQEMMGINMAMVLVAIFSITGCLAIAFAFGWKLTLVSALPALPLITLGKSLDTACTIVAPVTILIYMLVQLVSIESGLNYSSRS
jgi:ATP-binding cassette subfamily B (MDR/TAP) protein 1